MQRPPEARVSYLDRACEDAPGLRREVEELLHAAERSEEWLVAGIERELGQAAGAILGEEDAAAQELAFVGTYRIIRRIAAGGMGVVYEAEDPRLGRHVALKTLPESMSRDPERLTRLEREAKILASLNHPNVATIHSLEEADGVRFLTMELIRGRSLADALARGALDPPEAFAVCRRVARALEAAHDAGIIHRDLKPANVMLTDRDEVKVLDFGIAKAIGVEPAGPVDSSAARTDTIDGGPGGSKAGPPYLTRVAGTPGYMSPEQIEGAAVDERTDVFALGCLLYECLTGRAAFPGESMEARLRATRETDPAGAELPLDLPDSIRTLLRRTLCKDAAGRPSRMGEVHRVLERAMEESRLSGPGRGDADSRAPSRLPRRLTRFIGRRAELDAVHALLDAHPLVTLTGAGGCGKSRLALVALSDRSERSGDQAWYVDLAGVSDARLVAPAIVHGVEARPLLASDVESVAAVLRGKRGDLLLDNCTRHVRTVAPLVEAVLRVAPDLRILATSREPLRAEGESVFVVEPLALPAREEPVTLAGAERSEAVQLFLDRARLANPSLRMTPANVGAIVAICRKLDGLPVALELAGGRAGSLPPADLASRLERVLDGSSARGASAGDRRSTLSAVIDWSHDLLNEIERIVFRRLSVFAGGWTADAAERIAAGGRVHESDVLDALSTLVEKSLVFVRVPEGQSLAPRYGFLATVRRYARARLDDAGEIDEVRRRHRDYFVSLALERPRRSPEASGLPGASFARGGEDGIASELDNFRVLLDPAGGVQLDRSTGLALCIRLVKTWDVWGFWSEARENLDRLLDRENESTEPRVVAGALYWAGRFAKNQGDLDRAASRFEACRSVAGESGDDPILADALQGLGNVAEIRGEFEAAAALYEEGLAVAQRCESANRVAVALGNLGVVAKDMGDLAKARSLYQESMEQFRALGDLRNVAIALNNLGAVAYVQADLAGAREYFEESLAVRTELGDRSGVASSLNNLAQIETDLGNHEEARAALLRALALRAELGERLFVARTLLALSELAARRGETERSAELLASSTALRERLGGALGAEERKENEAHAARLREKLGARFEPVWRRGWLRPLEDVVGELLHGA